MVGHKQKRFKIGRETNRKEKKKGKYRADSARRNLSNIIVKEGVVVARRI